MKIVKLKLGTHMDNGLMYSFYQNQGQGPITLGVTSFGRFYNLRNENFHYRFLRNYKSCKSETWSTHGQWADILCTPESGLRAHTGNSWNYVP